MKELADPAPRRVQEALAPSAQRGAARSTARTELDSLRSLAREAAEIERHFEARRFREAQFELHELTENCVACHSRLPDPDDAALSSRFMDEQAIAALPLPERAQLAMATRQFERALAAQEAMLTSPEFDVNSIDLEGYLDDYLEVCVRVKRDFARPARALETFAKRPDLRAHLRSDLVQWVADLRARSARARQWRGSRPGASSPRRRWPHRTRAASTRCSCATTSRRARCCVTWPRFRTAIGARPRPTTGSA
jgi:hypothetical protein